jgi:beta-glucosidase
LAIADIIFGNVNPSGRLPVTFYKSIDDLPAFDDYSMDGRTYKFFRGEPLFPFGYGLSYTTIEYSQLTTTQGIFNEEQKIPVSIIVENTGNRDGDVVLPVYASRVGEPLTNRGIRMPQDEKYLVSFRRVRLKAGEIKSISFEIDLHDMYQWDEEHQKYFVEKDTYFLHIAHSERGGCWMQIVIR